MAKNAKYVSTCACGEVQFELSGPPRMCVLCYCQDCTTHAEYVDRKAQANGKDNISAFREGERGSYNCIWLPKNIECLKGKDKLVGFVKPKGKLTRTYTSCCNTSLLLCGGKEMQGMRPFNGNTLSDAATGEPFRPAPMARVMTKNANKEHLAAAPADGVPITKMVPASFLVKFAPILMGLKGAPGHHKGDTTFGFYNSFTTVGERMSQADYEAAGHSSGW